MTLIATLEEVSGGTELTLILKKTCRQACRWRTTRQARLLVWHSWSAA